MKLIRDEELNKGWGTICTPPSNSNKRRLYVGYNNEHVRKKDDSGTTLVIEEEQHGKDRAEYGKSILKTLSDKLVKEIGKGFSVDNLENMRKFYFAYSKSETVSRNLESYDFQLSWSRYMKLMRINDESVKENFMKLKPLIVPLGTEW